MTDRPRDPFARGASVARRDVQASANPCASRGVHLAAVVTAVERTKNIRKPPGLRPTWEELVRGLSWERARAELSGLPGGRGLNIACEAVSRHVRGARRDQVALV